MARLTVLNRLAIALPSRLSPYLFLLLLPFAFFWRETLGLRILGDQDAVFWFFPAYHQVVDQLRSLHLPLWNPYVYGGMPLFAAWQAGVLDPLNLIYLAAGVSSRSLTLTQQFMLAPVERQFVTLRQKLTRTLYHQLGKCAQSFARQSGYS